MLVQRWCRAGTEVVQLQRCRGAEIKVQRCRDGGALLVLSWFCRGSSAEVIVQVQRSRYKGTETEVEMLRC